jgi:glycosyltransferase involved in cell wall biosynthesis
MKILMASHLFWPSVGGIETMGLSLAQEWTRQGHSVRVVTQMASGTAAIEEDFPFEVVRQPNWRLLRALVKWCDVYFHNNISLQTIWPLLLMGRPWVLAHHTYISRPDGSLSWQDHLKRLLLYRATNISVSQAVADSLPVPSTVIGNCYRDDLFRPQEEERMRELVFLGRLVSDKGLDVLVEALALLRRQGVEPGLTVIGSGPEEEALQALSRDRLAPEQAKFVGTRGGENLVRELNAHRIIVVPSRWAEPFGIVALEGIACGCVAVGSSGGGLADAIGPCGVTFPNGDATALAQALGNLLGFEEALGAYRTPAGEHLEKHTPRAVATAYLKVFEGALKRQRQADPENT